MEKPKRNYFFTVFLIVIRWISITFSIALFGYGVVFFYKKISKFPEEIRRRIDNAKTDDKQDDKTT